MAKDKKQAGDDRTAALFVRLPVEEAEKLDRVAFELKRPKRDVIRTLVAEYLPEIPPPRPFPVPAPPAAGTGHMVYVPAPEPPEVLMVEQVAELLETDAETIVALAEKGELPGRKIGDSWRFRRSAVLEWLGGSSRADASD